MGLGMKLNSMKWPDVDLVVFDTETSGAYPVGYEVVEFGAVRWSRGEIVSTFHSLFKPKEPMSQFIIGIHGITNEMVEGAPNISERIRDIHQFMSGAVVMAHHAPFDQGFMAYEFEKAGLSMPNGPVLCTSLLSRKLIKESQNHKLQTLVRYLKLDGGQAHRATDDAKACLGVALECFRRAGVDKTIADFEKLQEKNLSWSNYQLLDLDQAGVPELIKAIESKKNIEFVYEGGSTGKDKRLAFPMGIVRNPDGDYVQARCFRDATNKRFYLSKMKFISISEL